MQGEDKFYQATIIDRSEIAEDLWRIRVNPNGEFTHVPGQYATLAVEVDGKPLQRAYSIVSSAYEKEVEFFFELVPQGALTPRLYKLQVGDNVWMRKGAKGRFTLDLKTGHKKHLLVGTVTGLAPYVSYVRTMYKDFKEGNEHFPAGHHLYILDGASRAFEFGFREELEKIAAEVPWLTTVFTVSRPWLEEGWKGETGRVDELIRKYADMWEMNGSNATAYLCGHPDMIENGKGILKRAGWPKESVCEEVYWIPAKGGEEE